MDDNCGYLALTRWTGERVRIETPSGEVIWVKLGPTLARGKARLYFEATPGVRINREEVWEAQPCPNPGT